SDLAMLLYGQFNVFRREEARSILERAHAALRPGGQLLLEPQDFDGVKREGQAGSSWFASPGGLFSEGPHLVLEEAFWDESERAATTRLHVVDAATAAVTRYALSSAAYTDGELAWLLDECGFTGARFHGPLAGVESPEYQFFALSATRV
ncbi:MAG TPA: hypothetical protein VNT60_10740, partial [Deinococcales bacterium]|nr:hypothetical protein [Deinococcales bacterium]